MNFDDLKLAWQSPDTQQQNQLPLPHSLVQVLIQQRSRSRLAELQRTLVWQGAVVVSSSPLLFWLVWLNPFGLTHWYSFVPPLGWASAFLLLGGQLLIERRRIIRRTRLLLNLREALEVAVALHYQSLASMGRLSLLAQLFVFATIGAFNAEHMAQMSALEAGAAWGAIILFAGLTIHHFQTRQAPRAARLYQVQMHQWLGELAELQATEG